MTSLELGHEQEPAQAAARLVAGRYRLHARIGSGRLGDVYEAHDEGYRELGITGTERLRRSGTNPAGDRGEREPLQEREAPPAQKSAIVVTGPVAHPGKRREIARSRRKRASRRRSLVLLPVVAALAAWYFYGEPRDDIANLAAGIDGSNQPADTPLPAVAEPAGGEAPLAPTAGIDSGGQPGIEAGTDAESDSGIEAGTDAESDSGFDLGHDTSGSTLIQSLVTVYERDGAARIAFRRPLGDAGAIVWWTADGSARADSDYIALAQPVAAFTSGEEAETLHIPLVNDGLPEPKETFFVFLGQRDPATGDLVPIARVRVDVNDDD